MGISTLSSALSGLKAAQSAINVISNNVSNASTPGYTRKTLPQGTQIGANGLAVGIDLQEIIRKVDMGLLRDIFTQTSRSEQMITRESYLSRLQSFHGASEDENSISAQMERLQNSFAELTVSSDDPGLLASALNQARTTAQKFNDLAGTLTELRNDAQAELEAITNQTNTLLQGIHDLNVQISKLSNMERSTAALLDKRDQLLRELSKNIDINYFDSGDQTISVLTRGGKTLIDAEPRELIFDPIPLGPTSSVNGGGAARLYIEGPGSSPDIDITGDALGGKVEALLTLRDKTLPQYMAQTDEVAQKTASRFAEQGLDLFVSANGQVPANVAPPAPVTYSGFASEMQVNPLIEADPTLLRKGTNGETILAGSNEILERVLEFAFGANHYYQSIGATDISAGTIFAATGLTQSGQVIGNIDITDFAALTDSPDIPAGSQFTVDTGSGPVAITINLGDTATDLVNNINAAAGAGTARLNGLGQLVFEATADITLADVSLGTAGIQALGHAFGTTPAENPSFTVKVGSQSPVTVTINPTDTATQLLAQLNAIEGITASLDGSGNLTLQSLDANGVNHGAITITDGPGAPVAALGLTTSAVSHTAFRTQNLGPDGDIQTGITGATTVGYFTRSMVAFHAEEHAAALAGSEREEIFYNTLNERYLNETGVDIDEELSALIRFQTTYTAVTQMIQAAEKQFDELINAVS